MHGHGLRAGVRVLSVSAGGVFDGVRVCRWKRGRGVCVLGHGREDNLIVAEPNHRGLIGVAGMDQRV